MLIELLMDFHTGTHAGVRMGVVVFEAGCGGDVPVLPCCSHMDLVVQRPMA